MPIYLYWGDDEFALNRAVERLKQQTLDPAWSSFNETKLLPDQPDAIVQALNLAMTPAFGSGDRLVWLAETTVCQRCSEATLAELERTLPAIAPTTVLLLTSSTKPDGRLKSTKLIQKYGHIQEFALVPTWKTELLVQQVEQAAQAVGVELTAKATDALAAAVGNQTRQLYSELEKLKLYAGDGASPLTDRAISELVTSTSQNSLQLGTAICQGQTAQALDLLADLLRQNEPALRIVSSLVGQFRTWVWVKLMLESGERNEATIAQAADIGNPKRVFFLKKEVSSVSLSALLKTLPLLLELESALKQGSEERLTLQSKIIELCYLCRQHAS